MPMDRPVPGTSRVAPPLCGLAVGVVALALAGCTQNPFLAQGTGFGQPGSPAAQQQQLALTQRATELESRLASLDRDNQELEALLAQSRQASKVLEDQVAVLQEQLQGTASQLARLQTERDDLGRRADTLEASVRKKAGATITRNNSLEEHLADLRAAGLEARIDGDVIRVELPGDRLFEPGSARMTAAAARLIEQAGRSILNVYPQQIIGIEGHTDSDPISGRWGNNHQLSVGRAMAVYDHLVAALKVNPAQLFVVGHGANHPVASNATPAGKERNRRVELVVYPETYAAR